MTATTYQETTPNPNPQVSRRDGVLPLGFTPVRCDATPSTRIRTYSERIHFSPEYATEYAYLLAYPRVFPCRSASPQPFEPPQRSPRSNPLQVRKFYVGGTSYLISPSHTHTATHGTDLERCKFRVAALLCSIRHVPNTSAAATNI